MSKMTVAELHRISIAHQTIARGIPNGDPAKPLCVLRTVSGKRALARNLRNLQTTLAPIQDELEQAKERLFAAEKAANPEAKELAPERQAEILKIVREVNARTVEVELTQLAEEDIDLDKFEGEEAFQALAILDGVVIQG